MYFNEIKVLSKLILNVTVQYFKNSTLSLKEFVSKLVKDFTTKSQSHKDPILKTFFLES